MPLLLCEICAKFYRYPHDTGVQYPDGQFQHYSEPLRKKRHIRAFSGCLKWPIGQKMPIPIPGSIFLAHPLNLIFQAAVFAFPQDCFFLVKSNSGHLRGIRLRVYLCAEFYFKTELKPPLIIGKNFT